MFQLYEEFIKRFKQHRASIEKFIHTHYTQSPETNSHAFLEFLENEPIGNT